MSQESNLDTSGGIEFCGKALRQAREAAGLSVQIVGERLHMPAHVIQALENNDWGRLGAPVFVRGQLRSYAKLLGVDLNDANVVLPSEAAPLISHSYTPRHQKVIQAVTRRAVYVVFTVAFVVPVWYATRLHFGSIPTDTVSLDIVSSDSGAVRSAERSPPDQAPADLGGSTPYMASLAPLPRSPVTMAGEPGLSLNFIGESWMEVTGTDGRVIEQGLMKPGDRRSYRADQVSRVVLGNTTAVEVRQAGRVIDLGPFQRTNVARFAVSSDGTVTAVSE
ncbi:MAG: DUF4115 domain-containing protein [Xanthomonadaceae bacterium]|nr:DUF4115 domain-containing protein [Xanthomonadaceae bacterium]